MEQYRLYKFTLKASHAKTGNWIQSEVTEPTDLSEAQELLEKILTEAFESERRQLPIGKEPDTGDKVLPNTILRNVKGVTLLKLHNPKDVNIWELKGGKISIESFPYSYIIIDNRPGIGQIAIQMRTDAWTDPDTVKRYLEPNMNRILRDRGTGLEIEIRPKWLPTDFFKYLKQRKEEDGVFVEHLSFEFTNPEYEAPIETAVDTSGHLRQLMNMLSQLGGAKAKLEVDAPRRKELIKKKLKDIKQMVSLVASNGYTLKVTFNDKSKYLCNDWLLADMDMKENVVSDFIDGYLHGFFEFELFRWIDEKRNETKDYKDDDRPIRQKPTRKSRKAVS